MDGSDNHSLDFQPILRNQRIRHAPLHRDQPLSAPVPLRLNYFR